MNRDQIAEVIAREIWDCPFYDLTRRSQARTLSAADAIMALDGWEKIDSAPRDGTVFLAWRKVPTFDEDARKTVIEQEPCIAQSIWGSVGSIPLHYQPQGQQITHWRPITPPGDAG